MSNEIPPLPPFPEEHSSQPVKVEEPTVDNSAVEKALREHQKRLDAQNKK